MSADGVYALLAVENQKVKRCKSLTFNVACANDFYCILCTFVVILYILIYISFIHTLCIIIYTDLLLLFCFFTFCFAYAVHLATLYARFISNICIFHTIIDKFIGTLARLFSFINSFSYIHMHIIYVHTYISICV